jgi:hypothetical protein
MSQHWGWVSSFLAWGDQWQHLMPLFGAIIVAVTTITVGVIVTIRLNTAMKSTEFFLGFTKRFHEILAAVDALHVDIEKNPSGTLGFVNQDIRKRQAHELYRQFFGLMYDEYFAYRRGLLDRSAFVEWMKWRYADENPSPNFPDYKFEIVGVSYSDGWKQWVKKPAFKQHDFIRFMNEIHQPRPDRAIDAEVRSITIKYGPAKTFTRISEFIRENVVFFLILLAFSIVFLLASVFA